MRNHILIKLQFFVMCIFYYTADGRTHFEDYCWRDYEGITPSDALQGGLDRAGKPIYIGQVLFQDKLIPAPLTVVNAEEIPEDEEVVEEDDSTTHTLDRLSSAATCLVAGVEYTHGQQIYRDDPCEFCLCLDGEMFCWWQDCPPTLEGPCRDRLPFSPCVYGKSTGLGKMRERLTDRASAANGPRSSASPKESKASPTTQKTSSAKTMNSPSTETTSSETTESSTLQTTEPEQSETSTFNTQSTPQVCIVMGKEYQIGASLPHDTGNCVECICGPGAQVTCSPHQCAPPGEDINDYRPPGPRPQLPDTF